MTKKPIVNALSASLYIFVLAMFLQFGTKLFPQSKSFLIPVAMISLFTLSAAVMGYLFGYEPLQLYFSNKKKEAVTLFLQTVGVFAVTTIIFFLLALSGIFPL